MARVCGEFAPWLGQWLRQYDLDCPELDGDQFATALLYERSVFRLIGFSPDRSPARKSSTSAGRHCHGNSPVNSWNRSKSWQRCLMVCVVSPRASICARQPSSMAVKTRSSARNSPTSGSTSIRGTKPGTAPLTPTPKPWKHDPRANSCSVVRIQLSL
mgnify:CR=1 FL=1